MIGEEPGGCVIRLLTIDIVLKQPGDAGVARKKRGRSLGSGNRIKLAAHEHLYDTGAFGRSFHLEIGRQVERQILFALNHPVNRTKRQAIICFKNSMYPDVACRL
jgi:hypothetical protein